MTQGSRCQGRFYQRFSAVLRGYEPNRISKKQDDSWQGFDRFVGHGKFKPDSAHVLTYMLAYYTTLHATTQAKKLHDAARLMLTTSKRFLFDRSSRRGSWE